MNDLLDLIKSDMQFGKYKDETYDTHEYSRDHRGIGPVYNWLFTVDYGGKVGMSVHIKGDIISIRVISYSKSGSKAAFSLTVKVLEFSNQVAKGRKEFSVLKNKVKKK